MIDTKGQTLIINIEPKQLINDQKLRETLVTNYVLTMPRLYCLEMIYRQILTANIILILHPCLLRQVQLMSFTIIWMMLCINNIQCKYSTSQLTGQFYSNTHYSKML